jgi:hypothetical protein
MVGPPALVHITNVEVIGEHLLRLTFDDRTVGEVSFKDRDWPGVFEPLRDPHRFAKVVVEAGTVVWPDDGLDMGPEPPIRRSTPAPGCQGARRSVVAGKTNPRACHPRALIAH